MDSLRFKIERLLPNQDKILHSFLGMLLVFPCSIFLRFFSKYDPITLEIWNTGYWLLIIGLIVGFGIEFYQKITKTGVFEVKDALYTALPFLIVVLSKFNY